ncbi:MAG: hypothetical protein Q9211_001861 [Gyalolechia sp. 1 TL-2023]
MPPPNMMAPSVFYKPDPDLDPDSPETEKTPINIEQAEMIIILRGYLCHPITHIRIILNTIYMRKWTDKAILETYRAMRMDLQSLDPTHEENPFKWTVEDYANDPKRHNEVVAPYMLDVWHRGSDALLEGLAGRSGLTWDWKIELDLAVEFQFR